MGRPGHTDMKLRTLLLAFGVVFLIVVATLVLVFVGTGIPLLVLGIRRARGHRSRASKIAMIVLGVVCGLDLLIMLAIFLIFVLPVLVAPA